MFFAIGVLNVDHYAVTTRELVTTLKDFLSIPGARLLRGPKQNPAQNVIYAFVDLNGRGVVEILSPLNDTSPLFSHLNAGGGAYHLCYTVSDLERSIDIAKQDFGARLVVEPRADGAFDGRKVAFLIHPSHGLFELVESYPSSISITPERVEQVIQNTSKTGKLVDIYRSVINEEEAETDLKKINMQECSEWDSFKHLLLIMEVEKLFEVNISASDMARLDSLEKINEYLMNK